MTVATAAEPGLVMTGEYLGSVQERDRTTEDGRTFQGRFKVKLLVSDRVVQVEYRDAEAAAAALGHEPERGDLVSLPVGVRSAKGYTFFYGTREP